MRRACPPTCVQRGCLNGGRTRTGPETAVVGLSRSGVIFGYNTYPRDSLLVRRLSITMTPLVAPGAVLVVSRVSASPHAPPAPPQGGSPGGQAPALLAALEHAGGPVEAAVEAAGEGVAPHERAGPSEAREHRRIAMPYFTFLPRG